MPQPGRAPRRRSRSTAARSKKKPDPGLSNGAKVAIAVAGISFFMWLGDPWEPPPPPRDPARTPIERGTAARLAASDQTPEQAIEEETERELRARLESDSHLLDSMTEDELRASIRRRVTAKMQFAMRCGEVAGAMASERGEAAEIDAYVKALDIWLSRPETEPLMANGGDVSDDLIRAKIDEWLPRARKLVR